MQNYKKKHRVAVLVSDDLEIEKVISFPIQYEDVIPYKCTFAKFQTDADRIFLSVDSENLSGHMVPVVLFDEKPRNVLWEKGFVFIPKTGKWDEFDVEEWLEEEEFRNDR